jgi:hypothetical protein
MVLCYVICTLRVVTYSVLETFQAICAAGIPEAERSLINQEGLVRRIQKFSVVQLAMNLLLLVPYSTLLEVWLLPSPGDFTAHPILLNRIFLYVTGRD